MKHLPFSNSFLKTEFLQKGHQPFCRHAMYGTVDDPDPVIHVQVVVQQAAAGSSTGPGQAFPLTLTSKDVAAAR